MTDDNRDQARTRRTVLKAGVVGGTAAALGLAGLTVAQAAAAGQTLELTPTCTDGHDTPSNIEGPFFKQNSPLRSNLVTAGVTGVLLSLSGTVYDVRCRPVAGALLEFWQCDSKGRYDNSGFTLRGHQFSTATGGYAVETVVPRYYDNRTPHIHVKVQAPHGKVLTSQLFFPDNTKAYGMDVARLNARDDFIDRRCTIALGTLANNRYPGTFEFVIKTP
jgi:protocatechuate 3,4-dioxygenase beta subunit